MALIYILYMVIISSTNGYSPEILAPFVESLNDTGYTGKKIMLLHDKNRQTKEYLTSKGWDVIEKDLNVLQHIQRYKESYEVLKEYKQETVLFLDCRDVFFNKNPENWSLDASLYVGVDGFFPLEEHSWGKEHMLASYPEHYNDLKANYHLNCGVIYGKVEIVSEFLLDVYNTALKSNQRIDINPMDFTPDDQMALNVLCYTKYKDIVSIQNPRDTYIINMVQVPWKNSSDYYIYHQYDRYKDFNLSRYGREGPPTTH